MQVAAFLSDLKSLSVCSHEAALHLVSVHESAAEANTDSKAQLKDKGQSSSEADNNDRKRANELALLHRDVKLKHSRAPDAQLNEAREGVRRILLDLDRD